MTLRTLNYGNYGIFLIMGNAGFCPSAVCVDVMFSVVLGAVGASHSGFASDRRSALYALTVL